MPLNRKVIKSQAKELIRNRVLHLFLLILIVGFVTNAPNLLFNGFFRIVTMQNSELLTENLEDYFENSMDNTVPENSNDLDDFDNLDEWAESFGEAADEFGEQADAFGEAADEFAASMDEAMQVSFWDIWKNIFLNPTFIVLFALSFLISTAAISALQPLNITLNGAFLDLIHGKKADVDCIPTIFKTAFDRYYLNRFLTVLITTLCSAGLGLLFIIPGIIYHYKIYFVTFILAENPAMTWREAITLSKKMTKGHKGELFLLDISFFGWFLLICVTGGIAGIYASPYMHTTRALYYENFKQRGLQTDELTAQDFTADTPAEIPTAPYDATAYYTPSAATDNLYYSTPVSTAPPTPPEPLHNNTDGLYNNGEPPYPPQN